MYVNSVLKGLVVGSAVSLSLLSQWGYAQEASSFKSWNYPDRYIRHRNFLGYIEPIRDELGRKDATFKVVPGLAGKCSSLESYNYPGHFLRHQNYRVKLSKRTNDELFRKDATFCRVKGLASSRGLSFESFNFPRHYIRHSDFELRIDPYNDSDLFRKDATFVVTPPLRTGIPFGDDNVGIPVEE